MVVLMVFTVSQVLKGESIDSIVTALRSVKPIYILTGIGMMLLYASLEGVNIWLIIRGLKYRTSILKCIGYGFVGFYFSSITPSASGGSACPGILYEKGWHQCYSLFIEPNANPICPPTGSCDICPYRTTYKYKYWWFTAGKHHTFGLWFYHKCHSFNRNYIAGILA